MSAPTSVAPAVVARGERLGEGLDAVMRVAEVPMAALQRLLGPARMPYVFILPNMLLFTVFVFVPVALPSPMRSPAAPTS